MRRQALRIVVKRDYRSERISMFLIMKIRRAKVKCFKDIYISTDTVAYPKNENP